MMDEWLANIYGTGGGEDLEKTAQALMMEKLAFQADQEGVDLSQFTEEELQYLANEVNNGRPLTDQQAQGQQFQQDPTQFQGQPFNGQQFQQNPGQQLNGQQLNGQQFQPQFQGQQFQGQQPQVSEEEMLAKEAQAKFEEADFLGRVMAHSFYQEHGLIEKQASNRGEAYAEGQRGGMMAPGEKREMRALNRAGSSAHPSDALVNARGASGGGAYGGGGTPHSTPFQRNATGSLGSAVSRLKGQASNAVNAIRNAAKAHPGKAGLLGGAALAGGAALTHHAMSDKEKNAEAVLNQLAEQRALGILAENGIDPNAQQSAQQPQYQQPMQPMPGQQFNGQQMQPQFQGQQPQYQQFQQEQPASDEQQLDQLIEKRAYAMLAANGYIQ